MDILNTLKSELGGGGDDKKNDLMSTIMNLIGGQSGGLKGLISKFDLKGLGNIISSWVGTGKNLPVSPDQIKNVLGSDEIKAIASKLGMDTNALAGHISNLLPQVVDKMTPEGKVPEGDIMNKAMDVPGGLLDKK